MFRITSLNSWLRYHRTLANEQYLAAHLQEVFGQEVLTINHLRGLSGLSKSKSPVSPISNYAGPLSLEKILAGISS